MENNENGFQSITDADLENARTIVKKIMSYYNSKVVNQPKIGISLLAAMSLWSPFRDLPRPQQPGL